MRVKSLQAIVVVSATLFPLAGEASLLTGGAAIPGITTVLGAVDNITAGGGSSPSSVVDPTDPVVLVSGIDSFSHDADQDKLRDLNLFGTDSSSCCNGGGSGSGGGGLPGLANFSLPSLDGLTDPSSIVEQALNLNLDLDLDLDLDLPIGECCDCNDCGGGGGAGQTVPEPSMFLLAASGLGLCLRRVLRHGGTDITA